MRTKKININLLRIDDLLNERIVYNKIAIAIISKTIEIINIDIPPLN